jgi:hypothetical protein
MAAAPRMTETPATPGLLWHPDRHLLRGGIRFGRVLGERWGRPVVPLFSENPGRPFPVPVGEVFRMRAQARRAGGILVVASSARHVNGRPLTVEGPAVHVGHGLGGFVLANRRVVDWWTFPVWLAGVGGRGFGGCAATPGTVFC